MVFVEDSGSVFDAQLDMVWKLVEAHIKEGNRIHPNTRNNKSEILNETTFINSWEQVDDANGQDLISSLVAFLKGFPRGSLNVISAVIHRTIHSIALSLSCICSMSFKISVLSGSSTSSFTLLIQSASFFRLLYRSLIWYRDALDDCWEDNLTYFGL